jgi:hypothetical protein
MPEAGKDNIMQVKRGFADLLAFLFDVDIVCINQADIGKKTDQVGIMGDLYGIATSVIVFLSEESDDSDLAIDFAEKAPIVMVRRHPQDLPTSYAHSGWSPDHLPLYI